MPRHFDNARAAYDYLTLYLYRETQEIKFSEDSRLYSTITGETLWDFSDGQFDPAAVVRRLLQFIRHNRRQPAYRKQLMRRQPWYAYLEKAEMNAVDNLAVAGRIRVAMNTFVMRRLIQQECTRCEAAAA